MVVAAPQTAIVLRPQPVDGSILPRTDPLAPVNVVLVILEVNVNAKFAATGIQQITVRRLMSGVPRVGDYVQFPGTEQESKVNKVSWNTMGVPVCRLESFLLDKAAFLDLLQDLDKFNQTP